MDKIIKKSQLKEHLMLTMDSNFSEEFSMMADALLNRFVIRKGDRKFRILELEFYHSGTQSSVITYKRQTAAGVWFFHLSGVDLSFQSDVECYGGILIRAVREIAPESEAICGPFNVVDVLFDKFDAMDLPLDFPVIEEDASLPEMKLDPPVSRWHPGKDWGDDNAKEYRFFLPEEAWNVKKPSKYPAYPFRNK